MDAPTGDFVFDVARKQWRSCLAIILSYQIGEGEVRYTVKWEENGRTLLSRVFFNGDPDAIAQKYVAKKRPVPVKIARAMLEKHKLQKGGCHSKREHWAAQRASDIACYLAMEHLLKKGLKETPAGEQVGELMHLSRQAVIGAWRRMKAIPTKK